MRTTPVVVGAGLSTVWQFLLTGFADSVRDLFWRLVIAVLVALGVALVLARFGNRGAAVGVSGAAAVGGCIAAILVTVRWVTVGWPLW